MIYAKPFSPLPRALSSVPYFGPLAASTPINGPRREQKKHLKDSDNERRNSVRFNGAYLKGFEYFLWFKCDSLGQTVKSNRVQ